MSYTSLFAQTRVACVGDSITKGLKIDDPVADGYVGILGRAMGPEYDVQNFGLSATTILIRPEGPKDDRNSYLNSGRYRKALKFEPHIVIIMLGTNDAKPTAFPLHKDKFVQDYINLIEAFEALPTKPKIILCYPPAAGETKKIKGSVIVEILPYIKEVAEKKKLDLIDIHTPFVDRPELLQDRVHPTIGGQRVIFEAMSKGLASILADKGEDKPVLAEDSPIVSLRDAHKGTLEIDLRIMNQYNVQPQAVQDFYTGCRTALTGPNPEAALAEHCRKFNRVKLGGPMLGDITSTGVSVWMHLPEPVSVEVKMAPKAGGASKTFTSAAAERFQSVRCEGLLPDTRYSYAVADSKGRLLGGGDFVTAPATLSEKPLKIAFGTCFHKVGLYRPELMKRVQERGNRAMLVLGDAAVDGRKCDYGLINSDYQLRNLSAPWQQLTANIPIFATWDDHDYWGDDSSGTETRGQSIDVDGLRKTWKKQWNNPDRDVKRKGIYFQTHIGPVHYIALDTRSCRVNDQRGQLNSFLGAEQMAWLKQQINESTSPYILVSGGTMWSDYISNGKDSWGTWDTEGREEIFRVIDSKKDSQVILLCGDRHGARGFAIPRPGGKKIYEFEVATMGGVPGPGAFGEDTSAQLFGLPSRSWAFGEFSFRAVDGVPKATFCLVNQQGEELETVVLEP